MISPFGNEPVKMEIGAGWGKEGSTLTLTDVEPKKMTNKADAEALAEFLWNCVPAETLDLALEEVARRTAVAEEAIARSFRV
jgi:hypothetical protein